MGVRAVAPLAIVKRADGSDFYAYKDTILPDGLDKADVKRLIDEGFLAEEGASSDDDEKPAGNASLEVWQDYAKSNGYSDEDLDGLGRDAVRDLFA